MHVATHNGVQTSKSSTNGETSETGLCDGGIDNPLGAETVQKTLGHLVTGGKSTAVLFAT